MYLKREWIIKNYEKSKAKNKMYAVILENKKTGKIRRLNFGSMMMNYHDKTGLNLYPELIHGDKERRRLYKLRAKKQLKKGYYTPSFFSYNILW